MGQGFSLTARIYLRRKGGVSFYGFSLNSGAMSAIPTQPVTKKRPNPKTPKSTQRPHREHNSFLTLHIGMHVESACWDASWGRRGPRGSPCNSRTQPSAAPLVGVSPPRRLLPIATTRSMDLTWRWATYRAALWAARPCVFLFLGQTWRHQFF